MYRDDVNAYESACERIATSSDDKKIIFELSIDFLNSDAEDKPSTFISSNEFHRAWDRAINSARLHIDKLISHNKFKEAEIFCDGVNLKMAEITCYGVNKRAKALSLAEVDNFFEIYRYRIIDRKYIYNAKSKIENIEKRSERKVYEVLTMFITIISVIFAFSQRNDNQGSLSVFAYSSRQDYSYIYLAGTLVLTFASIKLFYYLIDRLIDKNKKS